MQNFIEQLRTLMSMSPEQLSEVAAAPARKNEVNAVSGDNIRLGEYADPSENYKNALVDAARFYQNEFKVTPHATLYNDPDNLPPDAGGVTLLDEDKEGQYTVNLRNLTKWDENYDKNIADNSSLLHWHPKNSGGISNNIIHELGHALYGTLFPEKDTYSTKREYPVKKLYEDSLKDIGVEPSSDKAKKATLKVSGYAGDTERTGDIIPHEVVAESLVDYYYNRDQSAPLSKAIINRLKTEGSTYGIRRTGGVDLRPSASTFMSNLRRYKVIQ